MSEGINDYLAAHIAAKMSEHDEKTRRMLGLDPDQREEPATVEPKPDRPSRRFHLTAGLENRSSNTPIRSGRTTSPSSS
jgi:hypothetical protein